MLQENWEEGTVFTAGVKNGKIKVTGKKLLVVSC